MAATVKKQKLSPIPPQQQKTSISDSIAHFWHVIVPEPFVMDRDIDDGKFLAEMLSLQSDQEVSSMIYNSLQKPTKNFLIHCAEIDLKKLFTFRTKQIKCEIEKDGDIFVILILDTDKEVIGRGEIIPLQTFIKTEDVLKTVKTELKEFSNDYTNGNVRLNNILIQTKMLKTQIASSKTFLC